MLNDRRYDRGEELMSRSITCVAAAVLLLGGALAACANTPKETPPVVSGAATSPQAPAAPSAPDILPTSLGDLRITPVHHATVLLEIAGKAIYLDPWTEGKLDGRPKADLLLITDIHADHFDPPGIDKVTKAGTVIVGPPVVAEKLPGIVVMRNGESKTFDGIGVLAVPMYNNVRGPSEGKRFHDKGRGNGYVLTFGDKKVYVSGDTECIDEMRALKDIDAAFVCMNLPYTMPPAEAAECVKAFRPKVVYPYHYRDSKLSEFQSALGAEQGIEVRLRSWY
jgi:L-ascorbate metabolism protein UlaG (beta-lactamase superfamily)